MTGCVLPFLVMCVYVCDKDCIKLFAGEMDTDD